jgi:AraC-like DNA-binding protein
VIICLDGHTAPLGTYSSKDVSREILDKLWVTASLSCGVVWICKTCDGKVRTCDRVVAPRFIPYCGTGQLSFSVKHASPRSAFSRVLVAWSIRRALQSANSMAFAHRSPAHFSRKFKLAVGESPHAYAVRRRLERACYLMMTSAEPLSEIALSVGFSDQAHLCRLFRKAFGQSPANWRREREILGEVTTRTG